jgi:hypothetical protein
VHALALVRLPLAVAELEDIFVPTTRLDAMRAPLASCIRETAAIGEVLDGFVQRGMRKRMRFVRSARLFERERLKRWRMDGSVAYQEVGRKLDQLVASCKRSVMSYYHNNPSSTHADSQTPLQRVEVQHRTERRRAVRPIRLS